MDQPRWRIPGRSVVASLATALLILVAGGCGSGTSVLSTAGLTVTIIPPGAVAAGARWALDSDPTLRTSGQTVSGLQAGSHVVRFTTVSGYTTARSQTVQLQDWQTASVAGTYTVSTGALAVNILPASVVTAGAQWRLDGGATLYASGQTVSGLAPGVHSVTFADVACYSSPTSQSVAVAVGQTATVEVAYVATSGNVDVTINRRSAGR